MASDKDYIYMRYLQTYSIAKAGNEKPTFSMAEEAETSAAVAIAVRDAKAGNPIAKKSILLNEVASLLGG